MMKKLPFILIAVIIASIFLNPFIPLTVKQVIFACSLTLKSIVLFCLPFIIFGLLFKTFVKLAGHAASVILLIFGCLCTSNFINTFVTHYVGELLYHVDLNFGQIPTNDNALQPYFLFVLPNFIKNEFALFGGIASGLLMAFYNKTLALKLAHNVDIFTQKLFSFISVIIPLFIAGFVIKCASDGILVSIIKSYSQILLIFVSYATIYTLLFYFVVNKCVIRSALTCLKNMFPALITAFSTISSAVTMPVTIMCVEKNVKNKELASSVVSTTVNIHLLGDCLSIPLLAYALLKHFGMPEPSLSSYFIFTIFFVIAKFSVAAVPAGGIIIMAPILEKYLGFTPEMSTLIISIYVIFDPFVTSFNVMGNGALAKLIDNLSAKFTKSVPVER
ncbi:MAG: dicarboxylate/amino acid:cation symporter [Alphaproteobacteria bacterium]|nr:dicarboxylate/amino acid:cation symporter [Alphaproteobacteria bacterium]